MDSQLPTGGVIEVKYRSRC